MEGPNRIKVEKVDDWRWRIPVTGNMRVEGMIYADHKMIKDCLLYTSDAADE